MKFLTKESSKKKQELDILPLQRLIIKKKVKTRSYVGNFASYIHLNNQISFLPSFTYQRKVENKYGLTRGMGIGN